MKIAVIGLGYVGLPLACALARHFEVTGFDLSSRRINELRAGSDSTREISPETLTGSRMLFTSDRNRIKNLDLYIITVPTPVTKANRPDLAFIQSACEIVGGALRKGAIVTLESTVYPGVTEDFCGPILERASGLRRSAEFFLGYSPERINPGDREHSLEKVTKVVAGQDEPTLRVLLEVYGAIAPVYAAESIRTAEAAKVIENAQRDINIAFVNELSLIFHRLGIDTGAVLRAAGTKWNFIPFSPGLVGGHCISVDPYYLAYVAEEAGHHPEILLAGRRINDAMGRFVAAEIVKRMLNRNVPRRAAVLGITFKENIPDIRNSKSVDVVNELKTFGVAVDVCDPVADPVEVRHEYGIDLATPREGYGAVVVTAAHDEYRSLSAAALERMIAPGGVLGDVKGIYSHYAFSPGIEVWRL